jgi:hypothetical protein
MALSLKHKFSSPKVDGPDSTRVQPSNWNAEHDLVMASGRLVGRTTAGDGPAGEISVGSGLVLTSNTLSLGANLGDVTVTSLTSTGNSELEAVQLSSVNGGQLAGLRNKIINGDFRINQRVAATKAQSVGVYGFDRWKGHADGLEQIVEGGDIRAGTHTLSWTGGGLGRLNGGPLTASPITGTLAGGSNVSAVVPATATDVQLERGPVATPFEERPTGLELTLCRRYFQTGNVRMTAYQVGGSAIDYQHSFGIPMRTAPAIAFSSEVYINASGLAANSITVDGFFPQAIAAANGATRFGAIFTAIAEL